MRQELRKTMKAIESAIRRLELAKAALREADKLYTEATQHAETVPEYEVFWKRSEFG